MSTDLLIDMYYAAPEIWFVLGCVLLLLCGGTVVLTFKFLKLKQKNYFLNRDRERYAETLYASKDGYFAFIYPDQKIEDKRFGIQEHCSRRLAVMMNLEKGTASSFEDILKNFYKEDIKLIQKHVLLLKDDGVSFEDEFSLKNKSKVLRLSGARISGVDGNIYCDMIWFRDISVETKLIADLENEKQEINKTFLRMEDMINNIPYPIWLRDDKLNIFELNKRYIEYTPAGSKNDVIEKSLEISNVNGESISKNLALLVHTTNRSKKQTVNIIRDGERRVFEVIESPFHAEGCLDKIYTAGALIDITELDELKRNLKIHQNANLEIMGTLGTAFAIFDNNYRLAFYNKAFTHLWGLEEIWLEQQPNYSMFLDILRDKRMLPEVPDYLVFKNGEQKEFSALLEAKEDMLHLPSGQTIRRVRIPYPMGGLVFAYEDVSDKLAARRAYNSLLQLQQETLENIFDAVVIFGSDERLNFYNQAYLKLWDADEVLLQRAPSIAELVESQKMFFRKADNWKNLKLDIIGHIASLTTKTFILNRDDKDTVEVLSKTLSDGSIMITYKQTKYNL